MRLGSGDIPLQLSPHSGTNPALQMRLIWRWLIRFNGTIGFADATAHESARTAGFLRAVRDVAQEAGGDAPLPIPAATTEIEDTQKLVGKNQLVLLKDKADNFEGDINIWSNTKELIKQRNPLWPSSAWLGMTTTSPETADSLPQVEAIRSGRLLLDSSDPATPLGAKLAEILR